MVINKERVIEDLDRHEDMPNSGDANESNYEIEFMKDFDSVDAFSISGRRIISVEYYHKQIAEINHKPFGCCFKNLKVNEKRMGLISMFLLFECNMCRVKEKMYTDIPDKKELNAMSICGSLGIGIRYGQLNELFSVIKVSVMSESKFYKDVPKISKNFQDIAWEKIRMTGDEEYALAIQQGETDENGTPIIAVIVDGAWSKRSYKTNCSALSGVGCIIGAKTKKNLICRCSKQILCDLCEEQ